MSCDTLPDLGLAFRERLIGDACLRQLVLYNDENGDEAYRIHRSHVPGWGEDGEKWSEQAATAAAEGQCLTLTMPLIPAWIWFELRDEEPSDCINGASDLPLYASFDVEIVSQDIDETHALASAFEKAIRLEGIRSEYFGSVLVDEVIVSRQGENYVPKTMRGADWGFHWRALDVQIMPISFKLEESPS